MIWAVWASAAEEKALASSERSDVDAVVREGGWEASSEVIPWKLAENAADPVVYAVSRRYFSALYIKKVSSDHYDSVVWSAQSQSAMSNIPDFRMFSIAIQRIVLSEILSLCVANFWPTSSWVKRALSMVRGCH